MEAATRLARLGRHCHTVTSGFRAVTHAALVDVEILGPPQSPHKVELLAQRHDLERLVGQLANRTM
jgi:hypothetical protein